MSETCWIDVTVKAETGLAYLLDNGHREAWVPKSNVLDSDADMGVGVETSVEVPVWLAESKQLV